MYRCDEISELTSLYLDGELNREEQARLKQHVGQCSDCSRLFNELRVVDSLMRQAPVVAAPALFTERAVAAAFEDSRRRNVRFGVLVLMLGTLVISSLVLLGNINVLWTASTILFAPGFLAAGPLWFAETLEALEVAVRAGLTVLSLFRDLLVGPLLVPSLVSLLSAAFLAIVLRQDNRRALAMNGSLGAPH